MIKIEYRGILLSLLFACLLLQACDKTENIEPDKPEPEVSDRTVLMYLAGDNNLNGFAKTNIQSMLAGMEDVNGKVVIYYDPAGSTPSLIEIVKRDNKYVLDTIDQYPEEDSSSPEVLGRVARKVQELYPAESHGLFLWSHGTGWMPAKPSFPGASVRAFRQGNLPLTKTWGQDLKLSENKTGDTEMDMLELASALPDGYTFILFDACLMSTIEVLYELRNKADYIIASPVEILAEGFPYKRIMPFLWGGEDDLKQVCQEFYEHYANHPSGGQMESGVITLTRTEYLDDLALFVNSILRGKEGDASSLSINTVDRYPMINFKTNNVFFDLGDYIKQFADDEEYKTFEMLMNNMVEKWSTTNFLSTPYPADKYSGISTYIPLNSWQNMNEKYFELSWARLLYGR